MPSEGGRGGNCKKKKRTTEAAPFCSLPLPSPLPPNSSSRLLAGLNHAHPALLSLVHHIDLIRGLVAVHVEIVANIIQAHNGVRGLWKEGGREGGRSGQNVNILFPPSIKAATRKRITQKATQPSLPSPLDHSPTWPAYQTASS